MRFISFLLVILCFSSDVNTQAQARMTPEEYIIQFKEAAIADMQKTGVPASITLAQGMYESDFGNSPLALVAKNHFGIKCHKEWNGPTYHQDDDAADECFRKYDQVQNSYDDHSMFLRSRDRYHFLFDLEITDYKGWARGLKKAGYATNPEYANKLIGLIEKYNLSNLDKQGKKIPSDVVLTVNTGTSDIQEPAKPNIKNDAAYSEKPLGNPTRNRQKINGIPYVTVKKGDSWLKIAHDNDVEFSRLLDFNDADKSISLKEGDIIFLRAKKNRAAEESFHIVMKGENMRRISQAYGIRLKKLLKRNKMEKGQEPAPGTKIYLQMNKSFFE